jgi:capsular polysaccharide transport system permease protein
MNTSFAQAFTVQGRVLWALSLRELHGMHGETRLGYFWQIVKVGFSIAVFWGLREVLGLHFPVGLPLPVFLLTGFIPWFIFSDLFKHCMEAGRTNHSLLNFPQITVLDIQLGSGILTVFTHAVIFLLYFALFLSLGIPCEVRNPEGVLIGFLALSAFGFGLGLVFAVLNSFFPTTEKLVQMAMRILFFISGVWWPIARFARTGMMEVLQWNPILNYIELLRSCFMYPEFPLQPDMGFFFPLALTTLALGLFLERTFRARLMTA